MSEYVKGTGADHATHRGSLDVALGEAPNKASLYRPGVERHYRPERRPAFGGNHLPAT